MLLAIIFTIALYLSIKWIVTLLNAIYNKKGQDNFDSILIVVVCVLWGALYYFSH